MTEELHWLQLAVAALLASLICHAAQADDLAPLQRTVKREILALYDGGQEGAVDATRIHRFAELPLNHLGYVLRYRDVRSGLPAPHEAAHFGGVLTWFVGPVAEGEAYLAWADLAAREGLRFIVLGDLGAVVTARNRQLANRVMYLFGLRHTGQYVSPADSSQITRLDKDLYEFECFLDPVLPDYPIVDVISNNVRIGLQLAEPTHAGSRLTTLVAVGERGGFAAFNYEFCHQQSPLHRGKWIINPFEFFRAALGARTFPIPDPTTLSGRRVYFSLISSDGWSVPVGSERGWRVHGTAAEVVARELIEPFPELAVTLDLRDADLVGRGNDPARSRALAQHLLALPQVTRPGKHPIASRVSRLDGNYNSISNLTPLATGSAPRLTLTATSNELAYQTADARLPTALFSLRDTMRRTELPRRLKPANINFRMRVGREYAALSILRRHLEEARSAPLAPIGASLYAEIADGFFTTEIAEIGEAAWRITSRGQLQTFRFDRIGDKVIDVQGSEGVVGYTRHGGALYVTVDETIEAAVIRLTDVPATPSGIANLELADSRWRVRKLVREDGRMSFEAEGFGPGEFNWRAPARMACQVIARRDNASLWSGSAAADESGRLAFAVPVLDAKPTTIEIGPCRQ